jgi:hypothetical protein
MVRRLYIISDQATTRQRHTPLPETSRAEADLKNWGCVLTLARATRFVARNYKPESWIQEIKPVDLELLLQRWVIAGMVLPGLWRGSSPRPMLGWQRWRLALFDAAVAAYGLAWRKTDGLGQRHRVWRKGAAWTGLGWAGLIRFIY